MARDTGFPEQPVSNGHSHHALAMFVARGNNDSIIILFQPVQGHFGEFVQLAVFAVHERERAIEFKRQPLLLQPIANAIYEGGGRRNRLGVAGVSAISPDSS